MVHSEHKKSLTGQQQQPQLLGGTAIRPPERSFLESVRYFIHNPETGEFFTRTPMSWFLIAVFYVIYYTCLASFWYGLLTLYSSTLPMDRPKFTQDASLIGSNPGVGVRPHQPDASIDSSIIFLQYNAKDETPSEDFESPSNIDWAKRMEVFMEHYDNTTDILECAGDVRDDDDVEDLDRMACRFDVSQLEECSNFPYGYQMKDGDTLIEPCLFLKINRIFNWMPKKYKANKLDEFPDDPMPDSVKALVQANPNKVYIDCQGENPADRDALRGPNGKSRMTYFPKDQGIPFKYFPYTQANLNYHNPLIAVKFSDLPVGQLLHIECKLWSPGVVHNRNDRIGLGHFELIVQ